MCDLFDNTEGWCRKRAQCKPDVLPKQDLFKTFSRYRRLLNIKFVLTSIRLNLLLFKFENCFLTVAPLSQTCKYVFVSDLKSSNILMLVLQSFCKLLSYFVAVFFLISCFSYGMYIKPLTN